VPGHGRDPEDKNIRVLLASAEDPVKSLGWGCSLGYTWPGWKGRKGGRRFNVGYYVCMTTLRPEMADGNVGQHKDPPS
jgi:hypothetical protein